MPFNLIYLWGKTVDALITLDSFFFNKLMEN